MILFKKAAELRNYIDQQREGSQKIGFAPTMGALHQGHISLIQSSKKANDITVSSIFINPAQFNDPNDFDKYPVTLEKDLQLLEAAGCDILFLPSVIEMYPDGFGQKHHYDIGNLETILEGKYRPGHFQGVCMVVRRLLEIVRPDNLYLGQKDFQQCLVISRLISEIGMASNVKVNISPTLREPDGLAMSSRNLRLTDSERNRAPAIYETLLFIKESYGKKDPAELKALANQSLSDKGFRVDYVEIANILDLHPIEKWNSKEECIALIAAYNNEVRLIDNMVISKD